MLTGQSGDGFLIDKTRVTQVAVPCAIEHRVKMCH